MLSIDLHGQVAVVTGGSRGIGAATVKLLSQAGAAVAFSYHANRAAAEAVIAACPRPAIALPGDAADPAAAAALVAAATSRFGRLDIAVANAGIWNADDIALENLTPEQWDETVNCNLRGVYALARAAVRPMKAQPARGDAARGRIIAIASTAGQRGEAFHTHYGAAKAGVIGFVRGLAPEVARDGIRVNVVAPGWVDTDMARPAFGAHPERVFGAIPLGRPGRPEEIAGCIAFLCSPWSDFMTGSVMSVNGGAVLA
ncbi:MAG TPA: SDR family NAD(P)-dependent oxidoreductase [Terriglobales bacterium]|nr:SDR family NAD(P)-dependent oxidoreductase [Terriglobales bacterium]